MTEASVQTLLDSLDMLKESGQLYTEDVFEAGAGYLKQDPAW